MRTLRNLRRAAALMLSSALLLAAAAVPASAGYPYPDDDPSTAPSVPTSPFYGYLDGLGPGDWLGSDPYDILKVPLTEDQTLSVKVTGPRATDFSPILYDSSVLTDPETQWVAEDTSAPWTYPYTFSYRPPSGQGGDHFLWIDSLMGRGTYRCEWNVTDPWRWRGNSARLAGATRYGTAAEISKSAFAGSSAVVLATGVVFSDALAASGLAGAYDAPLLLTAPNALSPGVVDEVDRLGATSAVVVGGTGAVSNGVLSSLTAALALRGVSLEVTRVAGINRAGTAAEVAKRMKAVVEAGGGTFGNEAFVVFSHDYPDALTVSPFAFSRKTPILLTRRDMLSTETSAVIAELGITKTYIAGGTGVVYPAVESKLPSATRWAGGTRYETAARVASEAVALGWSDAGYVGVSTGTGFADALGGGIAAGKNGGVLLLNPPNVPATPVAAFVHRHAPDIGALRFYGGYGALSGIVSAQLDRLLPAGDL